MHLPTVAQVLYSGLGGHGSVAFSISKANVGLMKSAMVFFGVEPMLASYGVMAKDLYVEYNAIRTRPGWSWFAWAELYRTLERLAPDAIILHSVKTILPCALYSKRNRIPLIAVEHQANELKRRSEWWISQALMWLADEVIVLTQAYRKQLCDRLGRGFRDDKVHVIPNGIDTDLFAPSHRQAVSATARQTVGMAARMTDIKRHDVLVDAIANLRDRDGPRAWRLTLAGDGEAMSRLRALIRERQLEDLVELPGFLNEEDLVEWFRSLDIYAHASTGETLSTSILQAMAMGLPIVGSAVPGIGDLLESGGGIGLAVPQTPDAFATALTKIRDEVELSSGLRTRARRMAEDEFSQLMMGERYRARLEGRIER